MTRPINLYVTEFQDPSIIQSLAEEEAARIRAKLLKYSIAAANLNDPFLVKRAQKVTHHLQTHYQMWTVLFLLI